MLIDEKNVMNGTMGTKWAVNFKPRFCNAVAIKHKYNDSLPINEAHNYERKSNRSERYTQIL